MKTFSSPSKSGSALLLTLLVVSLLLVMVLSLSVYVRIELRSVQNKIDLAQARQNAKLGMHLALAQLQRAAGADRRVTGTADLIPGATADNLHVTGVWDTTDPSAAPQWLISTPSGLTFDVESSYLGRKIPLLDEGTLGTGASANLKIEAPLVQISGTQSEYAYWVADEGVKASLGLPDKFRDVTSIGGLTETEIARLRYATPVRSPNEYVFGEALDFEGDDLDDVVGKVLQLDQFAFDPNLSNPEEANGFHDYTLNARGLLTHPIDGGVKKDLSLNPGLLGPGFVEFMNFPNYLEEPNSSNALVKNTNDLRRMHFMSPPNTFTPLAEDIVHSVVPIITDFGIQFSPKAGGDIAMQLVLELWNPYTTGLVVEDLELVVSGFEDVTVEAGSAWRHTFDLPQTFGNGSEIIFRLGRGQTHNGRNPSVTVGSTYDTIAHGPGRILYWIGPDFRRPGAVPEAASFASKSSGGNRMEKPGQPVAPIPMPSNPVPNEIKYIIPDTSLTIVLRIASTGVELARYENFLFDEADTGSIGTSTQWNTRWLTYQARMIERGHTFGGDRSMWLKHIDRRTTSHDFSIVPDPTAYTYTTREGTTSTSPADSALKNNMQLTQDGTVFFFERRMSGSPWSTDTRRDIPLFELPRQPLISMGQLQHLHIHERPPYSIGNPWGEARWNDVFDDYFLSGMQVGISIPDLSDPTNPLPHPRYSVTDAQNINLDSVTTSDLTSLSEDVGIALSVNGQFNLNSTSQQAWKSTLGSVLFKDFTYAIRDTNLHDTTNLLHSDIVDNDTSYPFGFTRFPQSIQEIFQNDFTAMDSNFDRHLATLKPGTTFLTPRVSFLETDADFDITDQDLLDEFSAAIVEGIKKWADDNGRPYYSMAEFLSADFKNGNPLLESILQGDVDPTTYPLIASGKLRSYSIPSDNDVVPEDRTPNWLSQADIMSALAPFLSTRSDTFKIRAYGNVSDPSGQTKSKAWCEAIVERVITPVSSVPLLTDMGEVPPDTFGRKFKIRSFKWLNESEI